MRKPLFIAAGAIVVLAAAVYVGLAFFLGSAVRAGLTTFGPRLTQTKFELRGASVSPFSGGGTLTGLAIGNPAGWSDRDALRFAKIHVEVTPWSLLGDRIVIKDVEIEAPDVNYETKVFSSNLSDLLGNIEGRSENGAQPGAEPVAKNGRPLKIEIRHFRVDGGHIRLDVGKAAIVLPLPPIELNDLGVAQGGLAPGQVAVEIMRSLTSDVVAATTHAASRINATMGAAAGSAAHQATKKLESLFGQP